MSLQAVRNSPYTLLPSGILIVEPHEGLLAARTMLLAAAEYYLGVFGALLTEVPQRVDGHEVSLAILSESLGHGMLSATALGIRHRWPHARILIFGQMSPAIEDNLYDARIDHQARPEDLLAALVSLSIGPLQPRLTPVESPAKQTALAVVSRRNHPAESDPTKRRARAIASARDLPAGEQRFRQAC